MLIISLLAAAAAASSPTYLRCAFPTSKVELLITADEANSAVTITSPATGHIQKLPAAFTAGDLQFRNRVLAYTISRTDLTIRRTIDTDKNAEAGTCKVEDAPKRAF